MFDKLISWSLKKYSHLPWREKRTPYKTLVSEIMLQQTTVGTVLHKFPDFIKRFPDLEILSKLTEEEICIAWKGLGYYRRARNLLKASKSLVEVYQSKIPTEYDELLKIDGIGDYTASAIRAMGYNLPSICVDANIERILARLFLLEEEKGIKLKKKIHDIFINDPKFSRYQNQARNLNEAFMDHGRDFCKQNSPRCDDCLLKENCQAYKKNLVVEYPQVKNKKKVSHELNLLRFLVTKGKKVLVYQKKEGTWLEGQYELPTMIIETTNKKLQQYDYVDKLKKSKEILKQKDTFSFKNTITHYKIKNRVIEVDEKYFKENLHEWFPAGKFCHTNLEKVNFSSSAIKVIKHLKEQEIL